MCKQLLVIIIFLFSTISSNLLAQSAKQRTIYVLSVDFSLLTSFQVNCEGFVNSFQSRLKTNVVNNADSVNILEGFITNLKYCKKNIARDIRAKFIYEKSDGTKINICIDAYNYIIVEGRAAKKNKNFASFLRSLITQI